MFLPIIYPSGNKCYYIATSTHTDGLTWEQALQECRAQTIAGLRDFDLATISSAEENGNM
jgi:hypothetical protein